MSEHDDVYALPRTVTDLNDCYFYHTMDVPGVGRVTGEWDLRAGVREYLGGVSFAGKRVVEIGPASGFLSFFMEREGAEVVGFDLSDAQAWDQGVHRRARLRGLGGAVSRPDGRRSPRTPVHRDRAADSRQPVPVGYSITTEAVSALA